MGGGGGRGASRGRVIQQRLTESMVLAFLSALAGLAIAYAGRTILWSFRPPFIRDSDLDLGFDSQVLLFTLTVALLTAVLIGVAPALKAARPNLIEVLKVAGRGNTVGWASNPFRRMLLAPEIPLPPLALFAPPLFLS